MRPALIIPLACTVLLLGACSKEPAGPKTAEQVKEEVAALAKDAKPEPGNYRTTIKVTNISIPGMPQMNAEQMNGMFAKAGQAAEHCLTPEMASKGYEEFGKQAAQGDCAYDSFSADGGKMGAVMTCKPTQGVTSRTELHGTFSSTGSKFQMKTESNGASMPGGKMTMEAEVTSERIGDC